MTEPVTPSPGKTPRCCVIVVELDHETAEPAPRILWMNGDEGEARKAADAWCLEHVGEPAHIMVIDDTRRAEVVVKGRKA